MFQDWQEITNSIFCAGPSGLRQQMDVWFCEGRNHRRRHTCELRMLTMRTCALLRSASGANVFLLTKTYMDVGAIISHLMFGLRWYSSGYRVDNAAAMTGTS